MKQQDFQGKVAVITGSSMGIGKATADLLGSLGARLVLNGRNPERLQKTRDMLLAKGYAVLAVQGDVSKAEDCERLIVETVRHYGRLDILVNNAGMSSRGYFEELDPRVFKDMMDINFLGCVYPTRFALPYLKESRGSVVFISSVAGIRGLPETSLYCASKMALTSIAESLKVELAEYHIHVGIIYVGITRNEAGKQVIGKDGVPIPLQSRDQRKADSPEKVAQAIVRTIRKRQFKKILSGLGKLNYVANLLFPRLVDKVLVRAKEKIRKMNE
jgi:meso-butanediol dehydrogenase/(S,S)-butanediol dehydrogenase/diacetyl reductase